MQAQVDQRRARGRHRLAQRAFDADRIIEVPAPEQVGEQVQAIGGHRHHAASTE